jgi:hypothetical protein
MNRVADTSADGSVIVPSFAASTCVLSKPDARRLNRRGANAILALRCSHFNGRSEDYWEGRQRFRKAGMEVARRSLDAHLCELSPFPIIFANLKTS